MSSARRAVLALAAAAALGGCFVRSVVGARGTAAEPVVWKVSLKGARSVNQDALSDKLATHTPSDFFWREGYRLDADALAVDRKRIEAYYREHGYYVARVENVDVVPEGRGRAKVVFHVVEGRPVRVTKVEVIGLDGAPEAKARVPKLPVAPGDVFTESAYDAARGALLSALRQTGWANGEVTQQARVLPEEGTAEVTYTVSPGARYRFGPVVVSGTSKVPQSRVKEQVAIEIDQGKPFDETKLPKAQARVFDLGVFGGVRVARGTPDDSSGELPVAVQVREAPFRTVRFGPGFGVQLNRWDLLGTAGWSDRDFMGNLRRLSLDLRAGYAWLPTALKPSKQGPVGLAGAELQQPGVIARIVDLTTRLEVERGLEEAYDFWAERARLGFPLKLAPRWTLVPSYSLELYQVTITGTVDPASQNATGLDLESCKGKICLLSYLEQRIAWDGRDDFVDPHRGLFLGLSLQEGFAVEGYGYRYLRFLPEARVFLALAEHLTLAMRGRVGALLPLGESAKPPLVARFFGGGPASMRGYYTRHLSPMVVQDGVWVPTGGNGLVDGSVELRFPVAGEWGGAVYVDAGNVSGPTSLPSGYRTALDPTLLQWAAGVGVRYRTPFGPLRIDVAGRLPTDYRSGVDFGHRFPTVPETDHREPIFAVNLALGGAF